MFNKKRNSQWYELWKRFRRNRLAMIGSAVMIIFILIILFEDIIAPYGLNDQNIEQILQSPSLDHLFGTDQYGRDIFSRVIYGTKYTLLMGLGSVLVGVAIGLPVGALSGYYGGNADNIIMRIVDIIMTMPMILLAMVISASFGAGIFNTLLAVGIACSPRIARMTRSSIMSLRNQEFVEAAISNDASTFRIIFKYLLPNGFAPVLVSVTLMVAGAILASSSLSFLGVGLQPPTPEWGAMLSNGKEYMRSAWWICTFPGIFIALAVLAINLIGDGLRDAFDPKQKR